MELVEITYLRSRIRLLQERITAAANGSAPRPNDEVGGLRDEIELLQAQLASVDAGQH